jgi:regulator of protease activity HflC (stomatin/prohibitin superfamily)
MDSAIIGLVSLSAFILFLFIKTAVVVPQRQEFVVERLGKFHTTLGAGFHVLIPFVDRLAYKRSLKEDVMEIPSQVCITKDNVSVEVDAVIFMQVMDSKLSSYGVQDYRAAAIQLAQTTLRSVFGKISLDNAFEERENINRHVISAVDEAAQNWGVKVMRYEIKDIKPPSTVQEAMIQQMKAEREKRAEIARSEGDRQARINRAEGVRQEAIAVSEGEKQRRINEAEGRAREIELVARSTADGLKFVAEAMVSGPGLAAANLRVAERYLTEFGNLAKKGNTLIIPASLSDVAGMVAAATSVLSLNKGQEAAASEAKAQPAPSSGKAESQS